ncbi:MAG: restriction endonuclease [Planctomycetes bacterium]|nr:restriction endonuclease [Planctomycetota bacterium]
MSDASVKGKALEDAVCAIERCILEKSPGYSDKTFRIFSKKVIVVDEVRHEIDVWVEIDIAPGYATRFIFECKNWKEKVGKNEIIVFSEKISVSRAQDGIFVAKSFTSDAEAQARKDPRITLLLATAHDPKTSPVPVGYHAVLQDLAQTRASVSLHTTRNRGRLENDAPVLAAGVVMPLKDYITAWTREACEERLRSFGSGEAPAGHYDFEAKSTRTFKDGELVIDGEPVIQGEIVVNFRIEVVRPAVVSHFVVESRGRAYSYESIPFGGAFLDASFVST